MTIRLLNYSLAIDAELVLFVCILVLKKNVIIITFNLAVNTILFHILDTEVMYTHTMLSCVIQVMEWELVTMPTTSP